MSRLIKNSNGLTLLELLISIIVGSIVITTLLSILSLSVQARSDLEVRDRMKTESYLLVEELRSNLFNLPVHNAEVTSQESDPETIIEFTREYKYVPDGSGGVIADYDQSATYELVYDEVNETITYREQGTTGSLMHSGNVFFTTGTTLELTDFEGTTCTPTTPCSEGVLTLTLVITFSINGTRVDTQTFVTTIIVQ